VALWRSQEFEAQRMAKSPYRPFTPKPEQMALMPSISGNSINGMAESTYRRATPIYWHDPESLHHGELQKWFYTQNPDNEAINEARAVRAKILDIEVPAVNGTAVQQSAEEWTEELTAFAKNIDCELFGITALNPDWTYEDAGLTQKWVIMIGVAHDYEQIKTAPDGTAGAEVIKQYGRGSKAVKDISTWIRNRGWDADYHGGPMAGPLLLIPHAIECGFGELGKHGSIINEEYGSSFRLAAVVTDIPLIATQKSFYNVDDFCDRCQVCANACPPEAIMPEKVMVRGELKWYVDFDKCIPFFNENSGCAICISACPWSIPGRGPKIVQQLLRRADRSR
jgi:NAD-dependent dihydropyrimidine dehydrogenase PreA subunit